MKVEGRVTDISDYDHEVNSVTVSFYDQEDDHVLTLIVNVDWDPNLTLEQLENIAIRQAVELLSDIVESQKSKEKE